MRYRACRTETQDRIFLLYSIYKVSLVSSCPSFQSTVKQAGSNERPQSRTKEVANEGPFAPRIIRWRTTRPPRCRKPFDKSSSKTCQESQLGRTAHRFGTHLAQTNKLVERLKQVMVSLGEKPPRKKCSAGIIQEGNELMGEEVEVTVMGAALLAAAQRAEHYEIATYGCVRNWAKELRRTMTRSSWPRR